MIFFDVCIVFVCVCVVVFFCVKCCVVSFVLCVMLLW